MNEYIIDTSTEIPSIFFTITSSDGSQRKLFIDLNQNYDSIPLDILKEYSDELKNKFIEIVDIIINSSNLSVEFDIQSPILSNISSLKRRLDEYIDSQEPII